MFWTTEDWLAFLLGIKSIHLWHGAQSFDHRITDEVGERNFSTTTASEVVVDHGAVINHQLGGNRAHTCCSWNSERCLHALHDASSNSANGLQR